MRATHYFAVLALLSAAPAAFALPENSANGTAVGSAVGNVSAMSSSRSMAAGATLVVRGAGPLDADAAAGALPAGITTT